MAGRELDLVLLKILERIVAEVGKPDILGLRETGSNVDLVLVDLPRNPVIFEPFGKGRPGARAVGFQVFIADVGGRFGVRLVANGARPQMTAVRRRAGERR